MIQGITIDQLLSPEFDQYKVLITGGGGIQLSGILNDEVFSFSSSVNINSNIFAPAGRVAKGAVKGAMAKRPIASQVIDKVGNAVAEYGQLLNPLYSSIAYYNGTKPLTFTVSMYSFPNTMGNGDAKSIEDQLFRLTQSSSDNLFVPQTPVYFDIRKAFDTLKEGKDPFKGQLLSFYLGDRVAIEGALICESIQPNISRHIDEDSQSVYIESRLNFVTYRAVSHSEVTQWFKG